MKSHLFLTTVILFSLIYCSISRLTYTFDFEEDNLDNFFLKYFLNVQIDVSFNDTGGYATFRTTVMNVTPLHFSMFVNDRNCGVISFWCVFTVQPDQPLNIVIYKMDMQSNLITFVYRGGSKTPDLYINGCSDPLADSVCTSASQLSTDTRGIRYRDSICVCRSIFNACLGVNNDTCISNRPFWNNDPSTLTTEPFTTTRLPSTPSLSTTIPTTTRLTTSLPSTLLTTTKPTTSFPLTTESTMTSTTSLPSTTESTTTTTPTTISTTTLPLTTTTTLTSTMTSTMTSTKSSTITTTTSLPLTTESTMTSTVTITTTTSLPSITESTMTSTTTSSTTITPSTSTTETNSTNSFATSSSTSLSPITTSTTVPPPFEPLTLKNLSDSGVGINNVSMVLNDTLTYSKQGVMLNATQVMEISTILVNAANVPGLKAENSYAILENLDNMLYVDPTTMYQSGSSPQMVLQSLGTMVQNTMDPRIEYLEGSNLGFSSKKIDCSNLGVDDGLLDLGSRFELINSTDSLGKWHSIVVPLSDLCSSQDLTHVFFTIYRDTSLFVGQQQYRSYSGSNLPISSGRAETYTPPPRVKRDLETSYQNEEMEMNVTSQTVPPSPCARQTSLPSTPVMSATLLNNGATVSVSSSTTNPTMALLRFNVSTLNRPLHGQFRVTWWDVGQSRWSYYRQCEIVSDSDGVIEAKCAHLTDFAIIVDAALNDPNVCDNALITLGYVVNGLSIVSLTFLTFFSICAYIKTLSQSRFYSYVRGHNLARRDLLALAYHVDLLLFYVFFTVFSNQEVSGSMCTAMAAVMYALLLCSLLLTIFQALRNILPFIPPKTYKIVDIFLGSPSILFLSVAVPFTLSIFLLVFTKFFDRQDCFCWVRPDYVVAAIIIPVSVLLISTVICTCFMIYKVFFGMKRKFSQGGHHYDPHIITKIISIVVMQISLGLPWILQFGTLYSPYTTFWHYCFTIVLGSQGTILLHIFVYKRYRAWQSDSMTKSREPSVLQTRESRKRRMRIEEENEDGRSLGSSTDTFHEY